MKVVIDTNVLVSAIYWGGIPLKVLDKCLEHPYEIIISEEIWQEYCNVIRLLEERYLPGEGTLARLDYLARVSTMVETVESGPITSDPDDDIFFEAALSSGAGRPCIRGWSQASLAARPCIRGWSQASLAARPCIRG